MGYYKSKSIGERLNFSKELINIIQADPELSERMSQYNYGPEALALGLELVETASRLDLNQRDIVGRQTAATGAMQETYRDMRSTLTSDRRIARNLLRGNKNLYAELRLGIRMAKKRGEFLQQARHFYEQVVARDELLALFLNRYRIPTEVFTERLDELNQLESVIQLQQLRVGETRVASGKRREAQKELDAWMTAIIGVARQAFKGEEAQLEKLGVEILRSKPQAEDEEENSEATEVTGNATGESTGNPEGDSTQQ